MTELETRALMKRLNLLGQVKWMNFYDQHFALQYDKNVRSFRCPRQVNRVWFYGIRFNLR